jgi:TonB family protein
MKKHILGVAGTSFLVACGAPEKPPAAPAAEAGPQVAAVRPPEPRVIPPLTIEGYKKEFARKVAATSSEMYTEPVPEMLKSIVVVEVTIDRSGNLAHVAIRRSNGYKALENRAMDSVRRAAPFSAPAPTVRGHGGNVSFLETFLFRDDGYFRIRSLVE